MIEIFEDQLKGTISKEEFLYLVIEKKAIWESTLRKNILVINEFLRIVIKLEREIIQLKKDLEIIFEEMKKNQKNIFENNLNQISKNLEKIFNKYKSFISNYKNKNFSLFQNMKNQMENIQVRLMADDKNAQQKYFALSNDYKKLSNLKSKMDEITILNKEFDAQEVDNEIIKEKQKQIFFKEYFNREFFKINKAEDFILGFQKLSKEQRASILIQKMFRKWKMKRYRKSLTLIFLIQKAIKNSIFKKMKNSLNL